MRKCISLINVLFFLIDNIGVTSVDYAFDEVCGVAQSTTGNPGMTVNLTIDYRAPTPLHKPLEFRAFVASTEKRKIITTGSLYHGETLCAEATGIFVSMRPEIFERLTQLRDA